MNYGKVVVFRRHKLTSKVINSLNNVLHKVQNFETPEKLKGTFLERWGIYWKSVCIDYTNTVVDTVNHCKERPIKATIYATLLATGVYLHKHNPDESSFREQLLQSTIKIMQIGEAVRNPVSEKHVKWLGQCYNEGIVRRMNLGIISLIWLDDYDKTYSSYKAACPYLQVQYTTFYQRIVDFGILDKWWVLESKMKDYDVNEAEFSNINDE
ncbi:mitochondrial import inner membrane translocase subunit Tim29 isoform X2 [Megachile rotundata]|uniref:mitochondrial import inner membrane translocase subunit Tim29 isoform X2 n=1 Tax=Megachile rotundata TaxID=143995 RepID=UPI000258F1DA